MPVVNTLTALHTYFGGVDDIASVVQGRGGYLGQRGVHVLGILQKPQNFV